MKGDHFEPGSELVRGDDSWDAVVDLYMTMNSSADGANAGVLMGTLCIHVS